MSRPWRRSCAPARARWWRAGAARAKRGRVERRAERGPERGRLAGPDSSNRDAPHGTGTAADARASGGRPCAPAPPAVGSASRARARARHREREQHGLRRRAAVGREVQPAPAPRARAVAAARLAVRADDDGDVRVGRPGRRPGLAVQRVARIRARGGRAHRRAACEQRRQPARGRCAMAAAHVQDNGVTRRRRRRP